MFNKYEVMKDWWIIDDQSEVMGDKQREKCYEASCSLSAPAPHFPQWGGVLQLVLANELKAEVMPVTSSPVLEPVSDFLELLCTATPITKDLRQESQKTGAARMT